MEIALTQPPQLPKGPAWISPRTASGSVIASIAAHGLICAVVVGMLSSHLAEKKAPLGSVDLEYEVLDAPPEPEKIIKPVVRRVEPKLVETTPVKATAPVAQELQDTKGEVAGTQAAQAPQAQTAGDAASSAASTPFYKVKPKYPKAALIAGDEGWVMMKIDINEGGEVENVRVIDGVKRNLFQDEARRAVEKWKYRPFTDSSGQAVRKADHQVRVDFKLQDA